MPDTPASMRISMAGDDCSLHFDLTDLTPKQAEDHFSNQVLTGMLQVALVFIAKTDDHVCLYDTFDTAPWRDHLESYHAMFSRLGLDPLPLERVSFHPTEGYYTSVAQQPNPCELENLYMISGSNQPLHLSDTLLAMSRNLNSKIHFAEHAPQFGLPTPDTMVTSKREIQSAAVADFFARHTPPLMLKTLGLAGARNVTTVANTDEALAYLAEYDDDFPVILQARLDLAHYQEMTVDLHVSTTEITVTNVRRLLFAEGLWVGNELGRDVALPADHEAALLKVGEYARHHGYTSEHGYNLGIDYFVRTDDAPGELPALVVTEINARWTGGLFPAELVKRLGVADQRVIAFIDMCSTESYTDYLSFLEANLPGENDAEFAIAPLGAAPFPMNIDGREFYFVWQIVIGDFQAFNQAQQRSLGEDVLPTAAQIAAN